MTDRPKAYSYLRFSTPEQSKGASRRRQEEAAIAYAEREGLDLDHGLTFRDLGVSAYAGKNVKQGQLGYFLEAVEAGLVPEGSYLLVEDLDRISRQTPRKALRILEDIVERGITLVTLAGIPKKYAVKDIDSAVGLLEVIFQFNRAHEESRRKSALVQDAWQQKRERAREDGDRLTKWCPSWLEWDEEAEEFAVDEDKAEVVRRIFRDYLTGQGQVSIAKTLNEEGVPPLSGRAEHWHRSYVRRILGSPTVIGTLVPHKWETNEEGKRVRKRQDPIPDYYPSVVDEKSFRDVQTLLKSRAPKRKGNRRVKNVFAGLAHCGRCGGTMVRVNKGKGATRKYMVCSRAKAGAGCEYDSIRYDYVIPIFFDGLDELLGEVPSADEELDREVEQTEDTLMALNEAVEHLTRELEVGGHSPTLRRRLDERIGQREEYENLLRALQEKQVETSGPLVAARLNDLREAVAEGEEGQEVADPQEANTLLRLVFDRVTFDQENGALLFDWKHGGQSRLPYSFSS